MSELKDKLTKEVSKIDKTISNPKEKQDVLKSIQNMISDFTEYVVNLTERQNELEEKFDDIYDILSDIEEELVENMDEDFQAECPYCGEIIPFELDEDGFHDFECPKCHNLIELEMMTDDDECGCGGCHGCDGSSKEHGCHHDNESEE